MGQSLLGREEDAHESGLALSSIPISQHLFLNRKWGCPKGLGPSGPWMVYYYYIITIWLPTFFMCQWGGLWCLCYLPSNPIRFSRSRAATRKTREDEHSYHHPNDRCRFLDFRLYWGCVWDIRNKVSWCLWLIGTVFRICLLSLVAILTTLPTLNHLPQ